MDDQTEIQPCAACLHISPRVMDFKRIKDQEIIEQFQVTCIEEDCRLTGPVRETREGAINAWNNLSVARSKATRSVEIFQQEDRYLPDFPWRVMAAPHAAELAIFPSGDKKGNIPIAKVPGDSDQSYRVAHMIAAIPELLRQLEEDRNFFLAEAEYLESEEKHGAAIFRRAAANDVENTMKQIFEDLDLDRINLSVSA